MAFCIPQASSGGAISAVPCRSKRMPVGRGGLRWPCHDGVLRRVGRDVGNAHYGCRRTGKQKDKQRRREDAKPVSGNQASEHVVRIAIAWQESNGFSTADSPEVSLAGCSTA